VSLPTNPIPRRFYRVAYQRIEEAEVLYRAGYYVGAVYLAGYGVECMLKALIANSSPLKDQPTIEAEFRGQRAHQYEWLRHRYAQTGAPALPRDTNASLAFVSTWDTALRYTPGMGNREDASRFLAEARKILLWADNRF
jgi:hypothetical protein